MATSRVEAEVNGLPHERSLPPVGEKGNQGNASQPPKRIGPARATLKMDEVAPNAAVKYVESFTCSFHPTLVSSLFLIPTPAPGKGSGLITVLGDLEPRWNDGCNKVAAYSLQGLRESSEKPEAEPKSSLESHSGTRRKRKRD
jgi:hypothetical protein